MRAAFTIWNRETRAFASLFSTGMIGAIFLAAAGWLFASFLRDNEGSVLQAQTVWGVAVAPWLPLLCATLTSRLFSAEYASGMSELMVSAPVREREVVIGKYLAALSITILLLLCALAAPLWVLPSMSHQAQINISLPAFWATLAILVMQAALWCATGTLCSLLFRHQAASALCALALCYGVPIALYSAAMAWWPTLRAEIAWMPILVHVYDFSTGLFATSTILLYLTAASFFLFACSKTYACTRLRG